MEKRLNLLTACISLLTACRGVSATLTFRSKFANLDIKQDVRRYEGERNAPPFLF